MKYFSTFSGIGGFELGIQQAYELSQLETKSQNSPNNQSGTSQHSKRPLCIGFSEIDKYATQVYSKHFPTHKPYGDITKIIADELPDFDLLVVGFPCQAFSIAGKRGGFEDTRGTMFFELARILRAKQPRLFVFENVKGLLSHDGGKSFATIIQTLDELGYDCQWQVLNSKDFGVPQNRERVFIVGHSRGTSRPEVFPFIGTDGEIGEPDSRVASIRTSGDRGKQKTYLKYGEVQTLSANPMSDNIPRITQLNQPKHSNDRVYGTDGISPTLNTMQGGNRQPFVKVPEATKQGYAIAQEGDSINLSVPNSKTRRGRVGKNIAQTIDTGMHQHTLQHGSIRRLTPTECERLQGFPDGWTEGLSDTQRYKTLGNAVTSYPVQAIMERLFPHPTSEVE